MLRAKIDLRQPRDRDRFKSRFKEHPVPKVGCRNSLALHLRKCGRHSEIRAQAFSAVLDHVVSMRDRERARDGSVNVLSQRTLRVFSDHKQETDSSTKGLVCLSRN
jgi:hypothetical protein